MFLNVLLKIIRFLACAWSNMEYYIHTESFQLKKIVYQGISKLGSFINFP